MTEHQKWFWDYLDIETAPLEEFRAEAQDDYAWKKSDGIRDSTRNKIITIQYQQLDGDTGKPEDELKILKEWESSEEEIVKTFAKDMDLNDPFWWWNFRPVGNNLYFEWAHLTPKLKKHCGVNFDFTKLAHNMELTPTAILINHGVKKGSTKMFGKEGKAVNMKNWYYNKDYDSIENYIKEETEDFVNRFQEIYEYLKKFQC